MHAPAVRVRRRRAVLRADDPRGVQLEHLVGVDADGQRIGTTANIARHVIQRVSIPR